MTNGKGVRTIARRLSRSPSSISEEIRAGSVHSVYRADRAEEKARLRRKQAKQKCLKVALDPALKAYVTEHITNDQSPEAISGRLQKVDTHLPYASPKAIYHFVRSVYGRPMESHLYRKRVDRKGGPKRGSAPTRDRGKTFVDKRPTRVEERSEFGHFEGDFIVSGRDGIGALLVLVERKTRYPFLVYTEHRDALYVNDLISGTLGGVPVQSITLDNDVSFAKHEELSELISAAVYFCHAYASHEKGTVENRNGRIREFIPKKSDLSLVPVETIRKAEAHLRSRYMKCLGWRSPEEVWDTEMARWQEREQRASVRKNARVARGVLSTTGVRLLG